MKILLCISWIALAFHDCSERIGKGIELNDPRKFPFFAILAIPLPQFNNLDQRNFCGGSLIHPKWVLTAGHCVPDTRFEVDWIAHQDVAMVFMGSVVLPLSKQFKYRKISGIYRHPEFVHCTMKTLFGAYTDITLNDIALLQLNAPFDMSETVQVIQLSRSPPDCKYGIVIGAGMTMLNKTDSFMKKLKYATIPMKNNEELSEPFFNPASTIMFSESKMGNVYKVEGEGYALQGDSGGPIICAKVNPPVLIGLLSTMTPMQKANTIVNSMERVDQFIPFILQYAPEVDNHEQPTKRTTQKPIKAVASIQNKKKYSLCVLFVLISFVHIA